MNELLQWSRFSQIFNQNNLMLVVNNPNNYNHNQNVSLEKSFIDVQAEINPRVTFQQRKTFIDNKAQLRRNEFTSRLETLTKGRGKVRGKFLCLLGATPTSAHRRLQNT